MVTNGEALEMPIKYMQAGMIGMLFCIIDTGLIFCFFINMNTPVPINIRTRIKKPLKTC